MDITKIVGIVTAAGFLLGAIYDFGYLATIDINLFGLLSFKDHLETMALFIPAMVFIPGFMFLPAAANKAKTPNW